MNKYFWSIPLLLFCYVWFFLLNYLLIGGILESYGNYFNYFLYSCLGLLLLYSFTFESGYFGSLKTQKIHQNFTILILCYLLYYLTYNLLEFNQNSLSKFIDNYSIVVPSFSLATLVGIHCRRTTIRIVSIFRFFFYLLTFIILYSELTGIGIVAGEMDYDLRVGGLFENANSYGYFVALFATLCLFNILGIVQIIRFRVIPVLAFFGSIWVILGTGSYGSLLLILVVSLYLCYNHIRRIPNFKILSITGGVAIFVLTFGILLNTHDNARTNALNNLMGGKSAEEFARQSTFGLRYEVISKGINRGFEDPIFGKGAEGRNVQVGLRTIPVHNVILSEFLKGGVVGCSFILGFYILIWKNVSLLNNARKKRIATALFIFIIFTDNTNTYPSWLSMKSGVIAMTLIFSILYNNNYAGRQKIKKVI